MPVPSLTHHWVGSLQPASKVALCPPSLLVMLRHKHSELGSRPLAAVHCTACLSQHAEGDGSDCTQTEIMFVRLRCFAPDLANLPSNSISSFILNMGEQYLTDTFSAVRKRFALISWEHFSIACWKSQDLPVVMTLEGSVNFIDV